MNWCSLLTFASWMIKVMWLQVYNSIYYKLTDTIRESFRHSRPVISLVICTPSFPATEEWEQRGPSVAVVDMTLRQKKKQILIYCCSIHKQSTASRLSAASHCFCCADRREKRREQLFLKLFSWQQIDESPLLQLLLFPTVVLIAVAVAVSFFVCPLAHPHILCV